MLLPLGVRVRAVEFGVCTQCRCLLVSAFDTGALVRGKRSIVRTSLNQHGCNRSMPLQPRELDPSQAVVGRNIEIGH